MAMMISWVARVNSSHPYLENDPAPSSAPTICAFHLGFSLDALQRDDRGSLLVSVWCFRLTIKALSEDWLGSGGTEFVASLRVEMF